MRVKRMRWVREQAEFIEHLSTSGGRFGNVRARAPSECPRPGPSPTVLQGIGKLWVGPRWRAERPEIRQELVGVP